MAKTRLPRILTATLGGGALVATAAGLCVLAHAQPASAQDVPYLRGLLAEPDPDAPVQPSPGRIAARESAAAGSAGLPASDYVPVSPGALGKQAEATRQTDGTASTPDSGSDDEGGVSSDVSSQSLPAPEASPQGARARAAVPAGPRSPGAATDDDTLDAQEDETAPARRVEATGSIATERTRLENLPAGADSRVLHRDEENAFAPLGLRLGTFIVTPALEQGMTATNNVDSSPEGGSALLNETTLRVNAVSDWSRHSATIDAHGTYRKSVSGEDYSEFEGALNSRLQLDITSDLRGIATFDYVIRPEDASSPVEIVGVEDRPLRQLIDGSLGVEKDVGHLRFGLTGHVERDQYGDATLTDGTTLSQEDRDNTLLSATLRGGYEISPAMTPFVEAELGRRIYDNKQDADGYERSATRTGLRAGLAVDLREKLTGEVSAGWISEDADDDRLATISGPTVAASLQWSPVRGTTVGLDGATTVESTTDAGESGSILYTGLVSAERQIRSDLTGSAAFGLGWRDYDFGGHELTLSGEVALTWWLNRNLGVIGRARHERLQSDLADRDYDVSSLFLGLKLQR